MISVFFESLPWLSFLSGLEKSATAVPFEIGGIVYGTMCMSVKPAARGDRASRPKLS